MKTIKSTIAAPICIALSLILAGCGDNHQKVSEDLMGAMDKVADILGEVKDKASADAAAKKIEAMEDEFSGIAKRMKELGEPAKELADELEKKYAPKMKAAQEKMGKAIQGLMSNPEAAKAIGDAMMRIGEHMETLK